MKRCIKSSSDLTSERKGTFLKNVELVNQNGKYDAQVKNMLDYIDNPNMYFSYNTYPDFDSATSDWSATGNAKRQKLVAIDDMLQEYGASTDNNTYKVDWGTEPLYLTLSDSGALVVVDTASTDSYEVMPFSRWLDHWFGPDLIERAQVDADVKVAMSRMGVSYK